MQAVYCARTRIMKNLSARFGKYPIHLLSFPSGIKRVIHSADGLSAIGALSPGIRLPAVADTVRVTLGAGVPPRDVAQRGCNFERVVWGETFTYDVRTTGKRMSGV